MQNKFTWLIILIILLSSCSKQAKQEGIMVAVSIPPQAWFVSQIAGDKVHTMILAGKGQNHHNYEPTPKQIQSLSSASMWILSGAEFEVSLFPRVTSLFPELMIVDGTMGVRFRSMSEVETHPSVNKDDEERGYSFFETDRHSWLGHEPAKILASHIKETLCLLDYQNATYYTERYEALVSEIDEEFERLKITLAPLNGRNVFVYHPSFGYFFDEFGIHQEAVEIGGKEPNPRDLNRLVTRLKEEQAVAIFVQPNFPVNAAKNLASATGVELIELDPLAQDWLENIRLMGQLLQKAIP
jgi:zinc transport system substrate-binding protein